MIALTRISICYHFYTTTFTIFDGVYAGRVEGIATEGIIFRSAFIAVYFSILINVQFNDFWSIFIYASLI